MMTSSFINVSRGLAVTQLSKMDATSYASVKAELQEVIKKEGSAYFLKRGPATGLLNQGATCYLNSLMQSLFMTVEFRSLLYQVRLVE